MSHLMPICPTCGEIEVDGFCDCEPGELAWDAMLDVARQKYAAKVYDFDGSFLDFLRWKGFPPEVIATV